MVPATPGQEQVIHYCNGYEPHTMLQTTKGESSGCYKSSDQGLGHYYKQSTLELTCCSDKHCGLEMYKLPWEPRGQTDEILAEVGYVSQKQ